MHYAERINRHTSAVNAAAFCLPLGEAPLSARHAYITLSLDRPQKRGIECRERAGYNDCWEYPEDNAIFLSARWPRRHSIIALRLPRQLLLCCGQERVQTQSWVRGRVRSSSSLPSPFCV